MIRWTRSALCVACATFLGCLAAISGRPQRASAAGPLFWQEGETEASHTLATRNASSIRMNAQALATLATSGEGTFWIDLFESGVREIHLKKVVFPHMRATPDAGDDFAARGAIAGEAGSAVFLVRRAGVIAGAISAPAIGTFTLLPDESDGCVLRQMDDSQHAGRTCGMVGDASADTRPGYDRQVRGEGCEAPASAMIGYPSDAGVADLMVYYTPAARLAAGGVPQIEAQIALAVTIANSAYDDSGIDMQIRVVHAAEINYVESPDAVLNLDRLVEPADGFLDQVYPERDQFGGDLVSLWVDNIIDAGGVAYYPWALFPNDNGRSGFSVMRVDNAPFETFAHEVGHNYGCAHDRPNANDPGWYPFSYGYREPGAAWKTIMAYPPGTTVYYFSNPNLTYTGPLGNHGPLGVPGDDPNVSCDNARTHNLNGFTVANFRPSTVINPPSRIYVRASASPDGDGASWESAFNDLQDGIGYAARARGAVTEVWVAAGTYKPDKGTGNREWYFKPVEGVTLYGGFAGTETQLSQRNVEANDTILSGDLGLPGILSDNSYHVVRADHLASSAVLDGFLIRDGYADSQDWPHYAGGGLFAECSNAHFRNCTFEANEARFTGGGAMVYRGAPQFTDCTFRFDTADYGGAAENFEATPTYIRCRFIECGAAFTGGALNLNTSDATVSQCLFLDNFAESGGAARLFNGGQSTFSDCNMSGNESVFSGAAVAVDGAGSMASFDDCILSGNTAGMEPGAGDGAGILLAGGASMEARNCEFSNNSAGFGGAGCAVFGSAATFEHCKFAGNHAWYGAGMWSAEASSVSFENCGFFGNIAEFGGGGVHNSGNTDPQYVNCIFSANHAPQNVGGAVFEFDQSDPTYINCTFYGNTAGFGGGAVWADGGASTLRNCIVYNNSAAQLAFFNGGNVVATYSIVQGGFAGAGNLTSDPLLIDPDGLDNVPGTLDDNLRPSPASPAVDSGNNTVVPMQITIDYAGLPRFVNDPAVPDTGVGDARPRIDRGAHERQQSLLLGDMNCSGTVTVGDIAGFVLALTNPAGYAAQFPNCNINNADINQNGTITVGDIGGFVALLTGT